jgi:hypothetical protein
MFSAASLNLDCDDNGMFLNFSMTSSKYGSAIQ